MDEVPLAVKSLNHRLAVYSLQRRLAMNTPLTNLLNIKTPIIAAPMAGASGGILAAQVSLAGGFGFMAAGYEDPAAFRKELDSARSILQPDRSSTIEYSYRGTSSDASEETLAIGVGFLGWTLDQSNGRAAELLSMALEARVAAVWFAFGTDLGKWVSFVRAADENRSNPHKTTVFVLVNSLQEAQIAIYEWRADVLVAQGIEAGGHGHGAAPPLLELVAEILSAFPAGEGGRLWPAIIAAGGLSTGSQIAALLTLGTSGVALGTRFLLTPEAQYSDAQKAALLAANSTSTVRTLAFDIMRGTTGWPIGIDGRALWNKTVERVESGEDIEGARRLFEKATREGDADGMLVWSGTGVGLINEIKPAADIIAELHNEIINRLRAAAALLTDEA